MKRHMVFLVLFVALMNSGCLNGTRSGLETMSPQPVWEWQHIPEDRHCPTEVSQIYIQDETNPLEEWVDYTLVEDLPDTTYPCRYEDDMGNKKSLMVVEAWGWVIYKNFIQFNYATTPPPMMHNPEMVAIARVNPGLRDQTGLYVGPQEMGMVQSMRTPLPVYLLTWCSFQEVKDGEATFPLMRCSYNAVTGERNYRISGQKVYYVAMNHNGELFWTLDD